MIQQQIFHSPWPLIYQDIDSSTFDHHQVVEPYSFTMIDHSHDDYVPYGIIMDDHFDVCDPYDIIMGDHVDDYEFNTLLTTSENSTLSQISIFTNDHIQFPFEQETLELPSLMEFESFDSILCPQIVEIHDIEYQEESEGSFPSQNLPDNQGQSSNLLEDSCKTIISSTLITDNFSSQEFSYEAWSPTQSIKSDFSSIQQSLILPQENMEIDNKVILPHLMEAHGEALEKGQKALAQVNLKCISQRVTPLGDSLETLAFYLSQEVTNHADYLKGEAHKNFEEAFKVIYQGNPIGKIAHFAAISSILEAAMLEDCDEIHIIDFCIGNGIQWPFLLEAVSKMKKRLKLTSIKWSDENSESVWNFEDTKRELYEYAKSCGLKLKVEEKELEVLVSEIKRMKKRGLSLKKEFLAFNLMIGLLHMGMVRSRRKSAFEFIKVAEDLIKNYGSKGMITFGDGDAFEKLKNSLNFKSFFEGNLVHYKALLESIESQFSEKLSEARVACEVLFVAPSISSLNWLQTWGEIKSVELSLDGGRLSKNVLMEVREVLRGSESSYEARIEGQNQNELVLEWKGTQLLRFSIWKN